VSKIARLTYREHRCSTKRVYSSWLDAEQAAVATIDDIQTGLLPSLNKHGSLMAYRCDYCGQFHIGHFTSHAVRSAWSQRGAVFVTVSPVDWGLG
jgi:hypothetical protein